MARPATPAAPEPPETAEHVGEPTAVAYVTPPPAPVRRTPMSHKLGFRRTAIPVLLTTGVMMLLMGVARWFVDEEAVLARMPVWVVGLLIVAGAAFVLLGVLNMLFVRAELAKAAAQA
jgi:hypothetical protein